MLLEYNYTDFVSIVRIEMNNWIIPWSIFKDIDDQRNPEGRSELDCTNVIVMQLREVKIRDPVYFMIGKLPG